MYRFTFLLTVVLLFSCSDNKGENEPQPQGRHLAVDFAVSPTISRTTMDADYNSAFAKGDEIGVFATNGAQATNVKYTVDDGSKLSTATAITTDGSGNKCNFYAYYPYDANNGSGQSVNMTVAANQNAGNAFFTSDFVTANALDKTVTKGQPVNLAFTHRMALVELVVVMPEGEDMPLSATLKGCLVKATWDYANDQVAATGDASDVVMLKTGDNTGTFRAIVPEQTIKAGTQLFSIETKLNTYTFSVQQDISLKSNYVKVFKIGINVTPEEGSEEFSAEVSISSWQADDEVITGQGVEKPSVYIVKEDFDDNVKFSVSSLRYPKELPTEEGWYGGQVKNVLPKIQDDPFGKTDSKVAVITSDYDHSSWDNYFLGYITFDIKPGIYRMRAKVTSTSLVEGAQQKAKAYEYVMSAIMIEFEENTQGGFDSIGYFAKGTSPDGSMDVTTYEIPYVNTFELNGEYIDITADVDLTQCSRCTSDLLRVNKLSEEKTTPTPVNNMVLFMIQGNDNAQEPLYIDSFSVQLLEEK